MQIFEEKYDVLKHCFGYSEFRNGQEEAVDAILQGEEVLGIMPTGAGKSLCFQIPALLLDGITIVVSPLISLMKDQVRALTSSGVRAAYLNSSLTYIQYQKALENAYDGVYKIIYVAPERLLLGEFIDFARNVNISLFVVDEAHCISQWGNDFRPSYAKIPEFFRLAGIQPNIAAFTATATPKVQQDICEMLKIKPKVIKTGFDRKNLYFDVRTPENKDIELASILSEHKNESGIIYCNTRKNVEKVYKNLTRLGYNTARYHAGLDDDERQINQDRFIFEDAIVMVATNAFGMGIDKPDVRYVVHYNMPKDIESYYQEAGRAGRDGLSALCVMLFSYKDVIIDKFLIDNKEYDTDDIEQIDFLKSQDYDRLSKMQQYAATSDCLRGYILNYFGETLLTCGNCSNCDGASQLADVTKIARSIISCVMSMEQSFGKKMITDVLAGRTNYRIEALGLCNLYEFGILSDVGSSEIHSVIDELIFRGYLIIDDGRYPTLSVTDMGVKFCSSTQKVIMRLKSRIQKQRKKREFCENPDLFELLKAERKRLASVSGVPAFVICGDASLSDMVAKRPTTKGEFMEVFGIGKVKADKYASYFTKIIKNYREG